jgi:glycosyltransferase involved in cell wall biosynthesis
MPSRARRHIIIPFSYSDPGYFGGIERKILLIAEWFHMNAGIDAVLSVSHVDSAFARAYADLGLPVIALPAHREATLASRVCTLLEQTREFSAIAIESHQFRDMLCGAIVRRLRPELRHVYRAHTHIDGSEIPPWRNRAYHILDAGAQIGVDRYCALSRVVADELMHGSHVASAKVDVVHNGIPALGPFVGVRGGPEPLPARIAVVGQFERRKNQSLVVQAIADLRGRTGLGICARFVGGDSGGYLAEVQALACELGVSDLVEFVGPTQDVYSLVGDIDVHVLSSDFEGIPTSIVEAMSIGKLVICTDVGGTRELVNDGQNGLLFKAGDGAGLVHLLTQVFATPAEVWSTMRQRGRDTWRRDFHVEAMMSGLCAAFSASGVRIDS